MFSFSKLNLRRIASVFVLSAALFFSVTLVINTDAIAAEAMTRDVTNMTTDAPLKDEAYEAMKASRQQEQAVRSQMATPDQEDEGIVEKLNLDEGLPRSTEKFIDQVAGDEPIKKETRS